MNKENLFLTDEELYSLYSACNRSKVLLGHDISPFGKIKRERVIFFLYEICCKHWEINPPSFAKNVEKMQNPVVDNLMKSIIKDKIKSDEYFNIGLLSATENQVIFEEHINIYLEKFIAEQLAFRLENRFRYKKQRATIVEKIKGEELLDNFGETFVIDFSYEKENEFLFFHTLCALEKEKEIQIQNIWGGVQNEHNRFMKAKITLSKDFILELQGKAKPKTPSIFDLTYQDIRIDTKNSKLEIAGREVCETDSKTARALATLWCMLEKQGEGYKGFSERQGIGKAVFDKMKTTGLLKTVRTPKNWKDYSTDCLFYTRKLLKQYNSKCYIRSRATSLSVTT